MNGATFFAYTDPDPKRAASLKLGDAVFAYRERHGVVPSDVLVHPVDQQYLLPATPYRVDGVLVTTRPDIHVPRHSFYIGVPDATKETTEMSTTTVDRLLDQAMDEHAKEPNTVILTRTRKEIAADVKRIKAEMEMEAKAADDANPPLDTSPGGWNEKPRHLGEETVPPIDQVVDEWVEKVKETYATEGFEMKVGAKQIADPITDTTIVPAIPSEEEFFGGDFLADPHLQRLADTLCADHDLPAESAVTILWKRTGGTSGGKQTMGKCLATSSGLLGHYAETAFHVWIAADHCRAHQLSPKQIEALVYHELSHVGLACDDKTGECLPVIVGHDFAGFLSELDIYGAWDDTLATAKARFAQARLW